jgi:hypothetical protein
MLAALEALPCDRAGMRDRIASNYGTEHLLNRTKEHLTRITRARAVPRVTKMEMEH